MHATLSGLTTPQLNSFTPPLLIPMKIISYSGRGRLTRTMDDAIRKAEALIEALSYIRTFRDRLTVIKLGGSAMENAAALEATLQDVVFLETAGMRPILVHGGAKAIDRAMEASGLQPRKIQGRRYTDA